MGKAEKQTKKLLKDAIHDWLAASPELTGVGSLAAALGEPADSFRVRLSRNRWPRKMLEKLILETGLAASVDELVATYQFSISERTTRESAVSRGKVDLRARIEQLVGEQPDEKRYVSAAGLSDKELDYVTACSMSQKHIKPEFDRLKETENSTLIVIWNLPQDIQKNRVRRISMHAKLEDATFRDEFLGQAVNNPQNAPGIKINFHFLIECDPANEQELLSFLADQRTRLLDRLKLSERGGSCPLNWFVHLFAPKTLLDVFDCCWVHILPPTQQIGWALFDNEELRGRLQKIQNPWRLTTLAAPIPKDVVILMLERLGYAISFEREWAFTPDKEIRCFDLSQLPGVKQRSSKEPDNA
jgi:hypothetical protein